MSIYNAIARKKNPNTLGNAADTMQGHATEDRNRFLSVLGGGQKMLEASARNAMTSAMPEFDSRMQEMRESAVRRGISTGDLGTSFEGDLTSAFQRNIADSIAAQAGNVWNSQMSGYGHLADQSSNQWLDLLSGNADRDQAKKNAKTGFFGSIAGGVGSLIGSALGTR